MAKRALAFAILIGSSALAVPAAAQVTRNFSGNLSLGVLRDTNVARSSEAFALTRGVEREDTILTPSASIDWTQPIGRSSVFARGSVGYRIYDKNTDLNREVADIQGGFGTRVGPCQGSAVASFSRRQRDLEDLAIPNPKAIQDTTGVNLQTVCGLTAGLGVSLGAGQIWGESSGAADTVDYETQSVSAGLVYRRSTLGEAQVFISHAETEYSNALVPATTSGYEVESIGASYSRKVGSRLKGSVSASQTEVNSTSAVAGAGSNYSGLNYAVQVDYQPTSRLSLGLLWDRSVKPSVQVGRLYSLREGVALNASYKLGTRFTYSLGVRRRDNTSRGSLFAAVPSLAKSRSDEWNTGLRFQQSDRLSFVLDASHTKYDANDPLFDYSATRVGLTTSVSF